MLQNTDQSSAVTSRGAECELFQRVHLTWVVGAHREEVVPEGVPDVGVNAVLDAVELADVGRNGAMPRNLPGVRGRNLQPTCGPLVQKTKGCDMPEGCLSSSPLC
jgi:hypothetical protein